MRRTFEGMQLADWMRLSGVTGLTLRCSGDVRRGPLLAVLPRLTPLRSLTLKHFRRSLTSGGRCPALLPDDPTATLLLHAAGSPTPMHCTTAAREWCLLLQAMLASWRVCRG